VTLWEVLVSAVDRRTVLRTGLVLGAGALGQSRSARAVFAVPALLRARPAVTHGVQSGDVTAASGVVWARADRPARMLVEIPRGHSFRGARVVRGPVVTEGTDFTGKVRVHGLPAGTEVPYRVRFADLDDDAVVGDAAAGSFRTAPRHPRDGVDGSIRWSIDLTPATPHDRSATRLAGTEFAVTRPRGASAEGAPPWPRKRRPIDLGTGGSRTTHPPSFLSQPDSDRPGSTDATDPIGTTSRLRRKGTLSVLHEFERPRQVALETRAIDGCPCQRLDCGLPDEGCRL
jgi:hypothetical protein